MGNGEGIFAAHAERLRSYGLAVLPCDGKVPLVKWKTLTRPLSKATVEKLGTKHPTANIGFIPDLSGLVVVDVDDAAQVAEVEHIFGQTPVRARTSRGMHLYFGARKDQQIAACNLRSLGIEGEVKPVAATSSPRQASIPIPGGCMRTKDQGLMLCGIYPLSTLTSFTSYGRKRPRHLVPEKCATARASFGSMTGSVLR